MDMGRIDQFERAIPVQRRKAAATPRVLGYRCFQVLQYIEMVVARDGIAPSYNMICDNCGILTKGKVSEIIARLEKRGLLKRVGKFKCPTGTHSRNVRRIAFGNP